MSAEHCHSEAGARAIPFLSPEIVAPAEESGLGAVQFVERGLLAMAQAEKTRMGSLG
jgi:hypothetical protein